MPLTARGFNDDDTGRCPECGAVVYLIAGRCPKCGRWLSDDDANAMRSGRHVLGEAQIIKVVAAVLLFALIVGVAAIALFSR